MPKYQVTNPQFTPMDFAERIKPMEEYINTYNKEQDILDNVGVSADSIGSLIDPNKKEDSGILAQYNDYTKLLNDTVNNLVNTGNISTSRNALSKLRNSYTKVLLPIKQGYEARAEATKMYDQMKASDNTFIGTDPREHGISSYMYNNSPEDYSVSGKNLYAMAQNDAKAASSRNIKYSNWKLDPHLASQYFTRAITEGWSQSELNNALKNELIDSMGKAPSDKDINDVTSYMYDAYDRIAKTAGIDNLAKANSDGSYDVTPQYRQAGNYIVNGLLSGISYNRKDQQLGYTPPTPTVSQDMSLPYDTYNTSEVEGSKKIRDERKDLSFIEKMTENPSLLNDESDESKGVLKRLALDIATSQDMEHNTNFYVRDSSGKLQPGYRNMDKLAPKKETNLDKLTAMADSYGLKVKYQTIKNKNGTTTTVVDPVTMNQLKGKLKSTIILNTGKRYKNADNNNRLIDHLNSRSTIVAGIYDNRGKEVNVHFNAGAQLLFTPEGDIVVVNHEGTNGKKLKEYRIDPQILQGENVNNITFNVNGMTIPLTIRSAQDKYKQMYSYINNNPDIDTDSYNTIVYQMGELSDGIMRAIDAQVNSYPKVEGQTDSKL